MPSVSGQGARSAGAILMYHKVVGGGADSISVRVERFRAQMRVLADKGVSVIRLQDMIARTDEHSDDRHTVAITFDDGYVQTATQVATILAEHRFPATLFVVTDPLEAPAEFWWDTLERVFASKTLPSSLNMAGRTDDLHLPTRLPADRSAAYERVKTLCYRLPATSRAELIGQVVSWSGSQPGIGADRPMVAAELKALACRPGIDIGAHSVSHVWLPLQADEGKRHEISRSKAAVEQIIGRSVAAFSYPYGAWDETCSSLVRAAGFRCAVTAESGLVTGETAPYALPRCAVEDTDADAFAAFLDRVWR